MGYGSGDFGSSTPLFLALLNLRFFALKFLNLFFKALHFALFLFNFLVPQIGGQGTSENEHDGDPSLQQIDKLTEQRDHIESQLADPAIYGEDHKEKLTQLLRDKGELDQTLENSEEQWMEISEELEAAEAAQ